MRTILKYIENKRRTFDALPFFAFLRDKAVPPQQRFVFAPAGAPFIMAFADLNKHTLYVPDPSDELQKLINVHSREDATHYAMYLSDLDTLGYDLPLSFADALEFLWSDDRFHSRRACYELTALLARASPELRIVLVETIEALGASAFHTFTDVATEYRAATGKTLQYFGRRHEDLESGHTMGTKDIEERLHAIVLPSEARVKALAMVDSVYVLFESMMNELYAYSQRARSERTVAPNPA